MKKVVRVEVGGEPQVLVISMPDEEQAWTFYAKDELGLALDLEEPWGGFVGKFTGLYFEENPEDKLVGYLTVADEELKVLRVIAVILGMDSETYEPAFRFIDIKTWLESHSQTT
jgi:hypothetical protein